jgi:hypothetical protein
MDSETPAERKSVIKVIRRLFQGSSPARKPALQVTITRLEVPSKRRRQPQNSAGNFPATCVELYLYDVCRAKILHQNIYGGISPN